MLIPQEFSQKFEKLPPPIQEIMLFPETAEINGKIGEKYKLSDEQIGDMVFVIVHTIFKDIPLEKFIITLQQKLELSAQTAQRMASDIAEKRFLPIKNYLPGAESLIQNLSGKIPQPSPSSSPKIKNNNIVNLKNR